MRSRISNMTLVCVVRLRGLIRVTVICRRIRVLRLVVPMMTVLIIDQMLRSVIGTGCRLEGTRWVFGILVPGVTDHHLGRYLPSLGRMIEHLIDREMLRVDHLGLPCTGSWSRFRRLRFRLRRRT